MQNRYKQNLVQRIKFLPEHPIQDNYDPYSIQGLHLVSCSTTELQYISAVFSLRSLVNSIKYVSKKKPIQRNETDDKID